MDLQEFIFQIILVRKLPVHSEDSRLKSYVDCILQEYPGLFRLTDQGGMSAVLTISRLSATPNVPKSVLGKRKRLAETNNMKTNPEGSFSDTRVEGDNSTTKMGNTTMNIVDGATVESRIAKLDLKTNIFNSATVIRQEMKDFLSKPYIINKGIFQNTDTATSILSGTQIPGDILKSSTNFFDKVRGYMTFTGTTVLTLQVNATRFQQGRYMLCFSPSGGADMQAPSTIAAYNMSRFSLWQCSQLPHVELDVNCDTQAVLKIPYISCENAYSLFNLHLSSTQYGEVGIVFIRPYVPLNSVSGSNTCDYTLWAHFEDVDLQGPIVYQSESFSTNVTKRNRKSPSNASDMRGSVSDKENRFTGPVSSVAIKVKDTADIFKHVPLLSEVATPVSWVADMVANAAWLWGFSKPRTQQGDNHMRHVMAVNHGQVDGVTQHQTLAFTSKQSLSHLPGFAGTDQDEMSFAFIKKKPSYFSGFTWSTGDSSVDTELWAVQVRPGATTGTLVDNGHTVYCYTPVGFIQTYFQKWRGTLIYRFKFVKTEFHSGRIMIIFNPTDSRIGPIVLDNYSSTTAPRTIVDIRENNEVTVAIPFISNCSYMDVGDYSGVLSIRVLDPLVAPATVPSSISVIVEVFGGDDLEYAQPLATDNCPYIPLVAQAGDYERNDCSLDNSFIGGLEPYSTTVHSEFAAGEMITSFRQLLKMMQINNFYDTSADNTHYTTAVAYDAYPWNWTVVDGTPTTAKHPTMTPDLYSVLSSCFAIFRGGMNVTLVPSNPSAVWTAHFNGYVGAQQNNTSLNGYVRLWSSVDSGYHPPVSSYNVPWVMANTNETGAVFVNAPFYGTYPAAPTCAAMNNFANRTYAKETVPNYNVRFIQLNSTATKNDLLFRGVAEDFSFGMFRSIPPMMPVGNADLVIYSSGSY